ncbi:BatD family protein [Flavobacterium sp.]|uniref:BatD family protein n=1 Tax=Flavobacterium sp. TaxID=239 RepID=UPI002632C8DD|nr:BatD family protein [Flavobacterium sp.]
MKFKLYILFFLFTTSLFAQKVTTSIDSTKKKIGAEFKLTLKASVKKTDKVVFPKAKNFGALEVIESYKIDTIKSNDKYELIKKYGLTQFDSGKYTIPRIPILINGKPSFSDSIKVEVADVKVDTLKQKMYEIKDIIPVETSSDWWKYLLAFLILVGLGFLAFWLFKKYYKKPEKAEEIVYTSPIEKATSLLQQLERKELIQRGEIKNYYSELTDIARTYIEEEIHIPAMESTTSELIVSLRNVAKNKKLKLSKETLENLEKVLMQADLVKFAKVKPLDFEIEEDKKRITSTIVTIHKSVPTMVEKDDELEAWNEQQRELARIQKLKKQKQKRIIVSIGVVSGVLMISLISLILFKGFDYVKDNILGNETKELVEGEWVLSEYGNPGVIIETPKVLKRMDVTKFLPKDAFAVLKEMQMFGYGSLTDSFYVVVSTNKFKKETEVNFDTVLQGITNTWEKTGAQNILFKQEEFNTGKGVTGVKAYGTMTVIDKENGDSERMYYEILLFKQDGGLQQIIVAHREGDQYGKKIGVRIINSAELKQAQQQWKK